MIYTFEKDGKKKEVQIERWAWEVVYLDGTELKQFDNKGVFHQIGEVDQEKVSMFSMYKVGSEKTRINLVVQPGMRLIHFYRNIKPYYSNQFIRIYAFGYKQGNRYHYNFILPNDSIVQSSKDTMDLVQFELNK